MIGLTQWKHVWLLYSVQGLWCYAMNTLKDWIYGICASLGNVQYIKLTDSTFLEFTSWSTCWFSPITFHCNCSNALCFSSCTKEHFKYTHIYSSKYLQGQKCQSPPLTSEAPVLPASAGILPHAASLVILFEGHALFWAMTASTYLYRFHQYGKPPW